MNNKGEIIIPVKYDFLSSFDDGFATAILKNNFLVVDNLGDEYPIDVPDIIKIRKFSEGLALYTTEEGLMGFINTKGYVEIPAQFKKVGYFSDGLAWARTLEGLIGFIDKTGEWAIEPKFLGVADFDPVSQLAKARIGEIWGFIDKKGEIFYVENVTKFYDYSEGLAMAVSNGLFGFLDKDQNWKIEPQFEGARKFQNGYAAAKYNGKWGIIDVNGSWVIEPQYSAIKDVSKVN